MGPYINYKNRMEIERFVNIKSCFVFIYENERWVELYGELKSHNREFDELEESLGIMPTFCRLTESILSISV